MKPQRRPQGCRPSTEFAPDLVQHLDALKHRENHSVVYPSNTAASGTMLSGGVASSVGKFQISHALSPSPSLPSSRPSSPTALVDSEPEPPVIEQQFQRQSSLTLSRPSQKADRLLCDGWPIIRSDGKSSALVQFRHNITYPSDKNTKQLSNYSIYWTGLRKVLRVSVSSSPPSSNQQDSNGRLPASERART